MKLNYFQRVKQFETLMDSRYQPINLRFPHILGEYTDLLGNIINTQHQRKNGKTKFIEERREVYATSDKIQN